MLTDGAAVDEKGGGADRVVAEGAVGVGDVDADVPLPLHAAVPASAASMVRRMTAFVMVKKIRGAV